MTFPDRGYAVLAGPFSPGTLIEALDIVAGAIADAGESEVHAGSTTVRVDGILLRAPLLGALLDHDPLLELARAIIGGPFRLSSFHARSVRPSAGVQRLHRDVMPGDEAWPLAGFILMIDAFTELNGATRFLPGSCGLAEPTIADPEAELRLSAACGPAGSLIVFDGSTWHGHGANATRTWRRSVQGAFIPATATPAVDFRGSLPPEVWRKMSPNARSLLSPLPQS